MSTNNARDNSTHRILQERRLWAGLDFSPQLTVDSWCGMSNKTSSALRVPLSWFLPEACLSWAYLCCPSQGSSWLQSGLHYDWKPTKKPTIKC